MMKNALLALCCVPAFAFAHTYQNGQQSYQQSGQMQQQQEMKRDVTPTVGPLPNHDYDIVLDAEFLYWYSNVTNLDYATKLTLTSQGDSVTPTAATLRPDRLYSVDTEWDPGCRLGLGVVTNHDGWDLYLDWTYMYNSATSSKSVSPFVIGSFSDDTDNPLGTEVLSTPWGLTQSENNRLFTHVGAKWSILFHQFDLELGRNFWIAKTLTLRPYVGLRGHWSRMHLNVHSTYADNPDPNAQAGSGYLGVNQTNNMKQKLWSVGLLTGVDSAWHMTNGFSIFAQGDVSLTYGQFDNRQRDRHFRFDQNGVRRDLDSTIHHDDDDYALLTTVDLALGIRYETTLYDDAFRFLFDLGWENHIWLDFNHFVRNSTGNAQSFVSDLHEGNLTMSGLVVRGRFEF